MAYRICFEEASSIRPIKDEVPGWKSFNVSADLVEGLSECT
jgi:hypothetical protein